jgi:PAS domain S-box-containing protein
MTIPPTILIVDDDPQMCNSIEKLLREDGHQPMISNSGLEAMEWVSKHNIDIVLLDILMPEIDGFQVFDNIIQVSPDTLVIIMTGMTSFEIAVEALRRGAHNYLKKPFEPEELLTTIGNATDIFKLKNIRKQTEEALRQGDRRFRELVENSQVGICIVQQGQIVYVNPEQKRLFGDLPDLFHFKDLEIHPDDSKIFRQYCDLIYSNRIPSKDIELRFYAYDKTEKKKKMTWVNCRTSFFEYQSNPALLINAINISRSKELESRIQIREKMASLGQVATSIAHEIRNPLAGVFMLMDCIEESLNSPQNNETTQDLLRQAKDALQRIESVIKRVVNFSKPNKYLFKFTDINSLIKEVIMLSNTTLKKSRISVELYLSESLPNIYLDSQLIEQVLLNLINNAMDAMQGFDQRIIRIDSSMENDQIILKISDSGEGISPENASKIFSPFFTTRSNGSGIGLSLCQRIITGHGGTIHVSSSYTRGSEFIIRLPIEKRALQR